MSAFSFVEPAFRVIGFVELAIVGHRTPVLSARVSGVPCTSSSRRAGFATRIAFLLGVVSVLGACNGEPISAENAPEPVERFVHQIDMMPLVRRFLSPEGFMDQEFPPTVAIPSPYLSDFFGAQAIGDVTREEIFADFVPAHAALESEDENSVTLRFGEGFTATFYPISTLVVMGNEAPVSHVVLSGDSWRQARANVQTLVEKIAEIDRADAYLVENEFHALEQVTYELMNSDVRATVTVDPELAAFRRSQDGILLFPEAVHGISKDADELMKVIEAGGFDWIGFESLNTVQQPDLDAFNDAAAGTPEYDEARGRLVDYYADAWNGRAGPKTTGEENYYFKLAEAAHAAGARVIAIEGSSLEFLFFRYGETAFGGSVRSLVWANAIPASGRGILFGGGAHFHYPDVPMVQDFIHAQAPDRPFFSVRDLWAKTEK